MNRYTLIAFLNTLEVIFVLVIIVCSALFSWWLLLLLFFVGTSKTEERILKSQSNDKTQLRGESE